MTPNGVAVRVVLGLTMAAGLTACAARGSSEQGGKERTYLVGFRRDAPSLRRVINAPVDSTWVVLPAAFAAFGFQGLPSTEKSARVMMTPSMQVRGQLYKGELNSKYFDCGRASSGTRAADVYAVWFAILVQLRPATGNKTDLELTVDGQASEKSLNTGSLACNGTGKLEEQMALIIERMAASSAQPAPR